MALTAAEKEIHDFDGVKYQIINFQGYVCWLRRKDNTYAVDPQYLNDFKDFKMNQKGKVS
jgi:hypothetical protein